MARKIIVGDQEFIVPDKFPKSGFTIGLILVLLLAIWSSIYRVELEEEGVLMTLGEYSGLVQSGIHVKWPAPIQTVIKICLLYTSPSPRDGLLSRMPSSA